MSYSLNELYRVVGVSKQSVHQAKVRQKAFDEELESLIPHADALKQEHPGCGVEKMYFTLNPKHIGRDKFCEIFLSLGYGVKRVRNHQRTTISGHLHYPNLIEGMVVFRQFQVIQTDITYFELAGTFYYLTFIIDVYTRLIVGYEVSENLKAEANIRAMKMALSNMKYTSWGLIHHSDKGSQYSSKAYTYLLKSNNIHISMGNVAWENPYAERINGIIKNEYLKLWEISCNYKSLKSKVKKAVDHYNQKRKHRAFKMRYSPSEFIQKHLSLSAQERPTVIIYTEGLKTKGVLNPFDLCTREEPQAHICPMKTNSIY